jgi:hypothetical protein
MAAITDWRARKGLGPGGMDDLLFASLGDWAWTDGSKLAQSRSIGGWVGLVLLLAMGLLA